MNVEIESLPNCIKTLRIELPSDRVSSVRADVAKTITQQARIPGYRPGKAPKSIVEKRYRKEIDEELVRKLISESYREAVEKNEIEVLGTPDVEDVKLEGDSLSFTARCITSPQFDLPEYKGIAVTVPDEAVPEAELEKTLNDLRERFADFNNVEGRALEMEDFAVIDYAPFVEGQPLHDVIPDAPTYLGKREDFWLKLGPDVFLPGFTEQLVGLAIGEERDVKVVIPEEFPNEGMRGKELEFKVKLREIKTRILPELDDEFASKLIEGKNLAEVREQIASDMAEHRRRQIQESKRNQVVKALNSQIECELPSQYVKQEAQRIMDDIVRDNKERGVQNEVLKEHEKEIATNASLNARERLKSTFVLLRIAQKEKITVEREELNAAVSGIAQRHKLTFEQAFETLRSNGALNRLHEEILIGKALDFLVSNASVTVQPEA